MAPIQSNESLNLALEQEAWRMVSQARALNLNLIEKYADRLDWQAVSKNTYICWTTNALCKFADRIDWDEFSRYCPGHLICESILQRFGNRWNWERLSQRRAFYDNHDLVEKHADKVDWNRIIHWDIHDPLGFFDRFQPYLPMDKLIGSPLWRDMAKAKARNLLQEMTGEKVVEDRECDGTNPINFIGHIYFQIWDL